MRALLPLAATIARSRGSALGIPPPGTFFDYAALHILTIATLARLQQLYPGGRFGVRRFRPNLVLASESDSSDFVENRWIGSTLLTAAGVKLRLIDPCPRCVVTTLSQADLPLDPNILRVVARHSAAASVTRAPGVVLPAVSGAYAAVSGSGMMHRGDAVHQLL